MSENLEGQLKAFLREGAKDLHNAVVPAFPQSLHGVDEPGTPLNPTQQMVTNDLGESYQDYLASRQVEARESQDRGLER